MKYLKRFLASSLCAVLVCGTVGALTGCGKSGGARDYTIWLYKAQDSEYYKDYAENPVLKYLLETEWADEEISFEFDVPPAGGAQDNYTAMMASGDFPTLMQNSVSDPAPVMYDNGYILDLTELVKENMPNYYKLIQENDDLRSKVTFEIDGEEKILSLAAVNESAPYTFTGMVYRRDWIAKYGKNPSTNEAFEGRYTDENDPDSWTDNVIFPSFYDETKKNFYQTNVDADWDGSTPVYISDWEWMFEIFETAQKELGITDSYCTSVYYPGYTWAGGLCSCFGEGSVVWYYASDGSVKFGGTEDSTRAYFTCMNHWYEEGWLDSSFNERTGDEFYAIDTKNVRQGKVGMWMGVEGDLGGRIDMKDGGYTAGIYVEGCAFPINDVYGTDENKYVIPRTMNVDTSSVASGFFVMDGADEKDLPTLLKCLDYLYSEEGAVLRTLGLSKEQYQAASDKTLYNKFGLQEGAYTAVDGRYVVSKTITNDAGGLSVAASFDCMPGLQLIESVDNGYADTYEDSLKSWVQYPNKGRLWGSVAHGNMSTDDSDEVQQALTKVLNYMDLNAWKFIKQDGLNIENDSDWNSWCSNLNRFKPDNVSAIFKKYTDIYPV